jgi:hypothetical protein
VLFLRQAMGEGSFVSAATALGALVRPQVAAVALPAAALLWAWTAATLWRVDRRAAFYVPLASLAPLGLHALGSDAARFTLLVVLLAALGLAGAARVAPVPRSRVGTLAALAVIGWHLGMDVPLMARARDREGVLWPRRTPTGTRVRPCADAFENAGFERGDLSGWTGTGFVARPARIGDVRSPSGSLGRFYATSLSGRRGPGSLRSPPFALDGDALMVAIGGTGRVRLEVGGEVLGEAGAGGGNALSEVVWRIPERQRGARGQVVVTDDATEGDASVDGLCWIGR